MMSSSGEMVSLSALLGRRVPEQYGDLSVAGLQLDSRKLDDGDAFVALPGEIHDGRDYLGQASASGAVAIIAEEGLSPEQIRSAGSVPLVEVPGLSEDLGDIASRFYGHPSEEVHVIGVTGTNGKTTTTRLIAQLLRARFGECGVIGTLGSTLGNEVSEAANTTPDAISVHRQLAQWRDAGVDCAALEVSSHSLVQGRVSAVDFDTAVFTNLSHDHLDYHGDMENYGMAKSRLFRDSRLRAAIINVDDEYAAQLISVVHKSVPVISYSARGDAARVVARDVQFHDSGLEARLVTPWGDGVLRSPLVADFNLSNLLAAISAACVAGMPLDHALDVATTLEGVPGRMEYVPNDRGLNLVVDYAHTPDALQQALQALRAHTRGRLIVVFGCGGDRDAAKRPVMGQVATGLADEVLITSDNPRNEDPLEIISDIEKGCRSDVLVEADRGAAIELAVKRVRPGDCLLVAGKGHEHYQQVGDDRRPFSDVEKIRQTLARRVEE